MIGDEPSQGFLLMETALKEAGQWNRIVAFLVAGEKGASLARNVSNVISVCGCSESELRATYIILSTYLLSRLKERWTLFSTTIGGGTSDQSWAIRRWQELSG